MRGEPKAETRLFSPSFSPRVHPHPFSKTMKSKPFSTHEISAARHFAYRIGSDKRQPGGRRVRAIQIDNWIAGDTPMPDGGNAEIRKALRQLRAAVRASEVRQSIRGEGLAMR